MIRFLERHGIPYYHLPTTKEDKREGEILEIVRDTDFLVLARYMQVINPRDITVTLVFSYIEIIVDLFRWNSSSSCNMF